MTKKVAVVFKERKNQNDQNEEAKEKLKKRRKEFEREWEKATPRERGGMAFDLYLKLWRLMHELIRNHRHPPTMYKKG
jgi:hypothetical protein